MQYMLLYFICQCIYQFLKFVFYMAKRFGLIALPLQIVKQQEFAHKIETSNQMVAESTQYLKLFVERIYNICGHSAKQFNKLIASTQNQLHSNRQQQYFNKFLADLFEIFQYIESQISRIIILLKNNKKYESIKKLNQVINEKLLKAGENVSIFISMVKDYNALDEKYIEKAKYFHEIQKNPVKYYSIAINQKKYRKIKKLEDELEERLEAIVKIKGQIRVMMNELSNKIKDLYQNFMRKIDQVRKSSQAVLLKIIQLIKGFHSIPEVSERAEQESESAMQRSYQKQKQNNIIQYKRESLTMKQQVRQIKKDKISQFERFTNFKQIFFTFLTSFLQIIKSTIKQLNAIGNEKQYKEFYTQKRKFISELLPLRSVQDIDTIIQAYKAFVIIFVGIEKIMRKDMFEEIFKYQSIKFANFIEQIQQFQEEDIERLKIEEQNKLFSRIKQKEKIYCQQESNWKKQLQDKYKEIVSRIRLQFLSKGNIQVQEKASKQSELFSQKHFQILKHMYFQNNKAIVQFVRSDTIIAYQKIMKSNRIKNILQDIEMGNNQLASQLQSNNKQPKSQLTRVKSSCCCFSLKTKKNSEEANLVNKIKQSKQIDHYSCALKEGYLLFQGRMTIYEDYLGFRSSFNPSTFFGSTDILIPKFQIYQFIKGRHIMSEMITVVTKRGSIEFTSFFVDPFDVLNEVYKPNRNTQNEIVTLQQLENNQQHQSELELLKQKMESQFIQMARKQQFIVNNVKSHVDEKSLQMYYQYTDAILNTKSKMEQSNRKQNQKLMAFSVTIKYYDSSLQYFFKHSQHESIQRKKKLEMITKSLIDEDRVKKFDNFAKTLKEKQRESMDDNISFNMGEQFSIIGSKQKHRLDFGQFEMMPLTAPQVGTPTNRRDTSQDFHNLLQQNETKINEHQFRSNTKMDKYPKILDNLQSNVEQGSQNKVVVISKNQTVRPSLNHQSKNQIHNRQNRRQQKSVRSDASTVKYGEKQSRLHRNNETLKFSSSEHRDRSFEKLTREQGFKNLLLMVGVAFGLICLIKFFA